MLKKFCENRYRIIFLVVTIITLWYLDGVLSIKNDDGIMQASAMYYQPRNTVDVVMMGSSHVHYAIRGHFGRNMELRPMITAQLSSRFG